MADGPWLRQASHAGALLAALGAVVWLSGLPFLFPSLGPTAYLFAAQPSARASAARRVLGGHVIDVLAGLVAYHAVADGVGSTAPIGPASTAALRLAASGVVAVALTTAGMTVTTLRPARRRSSSGSASSRRRDRARLSCSR